jgi:hypothetical protein
MQRRKNKHLFGFNYKIQGLLDYALTSEMTL